MSEPIDIRTITADDADAVYSLLCRLNEALGDPKPARNSRSLKEFLQSNRLFGALAEKAGDPVGYALGHMAVTTEVLESGAYLADLFVSKHVRRQGVARRLIDAFAAETEKRGGQHIWWIAMQGNIAAREAYAALDAGEEAMTAHAIHNNAFLEAVARAKSDQSKQEKDT